MSDFEALIRAYEAEGHSVFRPSSASRWTVCAGSVRAEIAAQVDRAGFDAAYGTVAHALAEEWLRSGKRPDAAIGSTREERGFVVEITAEMLGYVEQYVEWCLDLGPADVVAIEQRVDFSDLTPLKGQGGTADHIHIRDGVLTITDLKFGTGVRVYARNNKQARIYAYGAWREWEWAFDIQRIVIRICQPRLDVFEVWELTLADLLSYAEEVKAAAYKAWQPNAPRTPHPDACRFCTVQATCPAMVALAQKAADEIFDAMDGMEVQPETVSVPDAVIGPRSDPTKLSTEELAIALRWRGVFDAFFRGAHDELLGRASGGAQVPGWKVVEGTTKRQWADQEGAVEALIGLGIPDNELWDRKLISPKRASDLLRVRKVKPKAIEPLIVKPPGKRALVSEDDGREGYDSAADGVFDDLA